MHLVSSKKKVDPEYYIRCKCCAGGNSFAPLRPHAVRIEAGSADLGEETVTYPVESMMCGECGYLHATDEQRINNKLSFDFAWGELERIQSEAKIIDECLDLPWLWPV